MKMNAMNKNMIINLQQEKYTVYICHILLHPHPFPQLNLLFIQFFKFKFLLKSMYLYIKINRNNFDMTLTTINLFPLFHKSYVLINKSCARMWYVQSIQISKILLHTSISKNHLIVLAHYFAVEHYFTEQHSFH